MIENKFSNSQPSVFKMFKPPLFDVLSFLWLTVFACGSSSVDVVQVPDAQDGRRIGTVYKLTVTPARESVPAFKYRLTVEPHKTIAGNAITHYLRSLGESSLNHPWETAQKEFGMEVHDWYHLETKVEDIPLDKLKTAAGYFDGYVDNHLRRATLCRDADWGLAEEDLRGRETIYFLLPSVQQTRSMARALLLRNRLAVIEGRYEDSIDHLRMTYKLGQNVSKMRVLVAGLVGIAEVGMANEGMIDLIAAKDSPNMYWALAELPRPIISIRESLRLESSFAFRFFPELMDVETAEFSKDKWSVLLTDVVGSLQNLNIYDPPTSPDKNSLQTKFLAAGIALAGYPSAKKRLLESGMDPATIKKMPVAQTLLIDAARDCRLLTNEIEKAYYVPYENVGEFNTKTEDMLRSQAPTRLGAKIVQTFSPALAQVRQAELRVQAQINILMAIESIRNHVATTGKLPASFDELKLPVRSNPFTGKPISYELKGDMAVVSRKSKGNPLFPQRFEISIAPQ